jgi:hypothetical protein
MIELLARLLAIPFIANLIIWYAQKTPYYHLEGYMERWWIVPFKDPEIGNGCRQIKFFENPLWWWLQQHDIAIRIHHILRKDEDRHMHDHPWNARTFILKGQYKEYRVKGIYVRKAGSTATINYAEYHRIASVSEGGVWTILVTGIYQGSWGFNVSGIKVPWREYLKERENATHS